MQSYENDYIELGLSDKGDSMPIIPAEDDIMTEKPHHIKYKYNLESKKKDHPWNR